MAKIEELPDDHVEEPVIGPMRPPPPPAAPAPSGPDAPLSLEAMIQQASEAHFAKNPIDGSSAPGAELPSAMAEIKNTTADEFLRQMNKMPLFMTELDETGADDTSENTALEAIKALQEEGEPWEVALNFKISGNERFKQKMYLDAREFYTKALAVKCDRDDINVACLNNRAQCNLEMRNYRKCITDCREALKITPNAEKTWFRSAKALLALDKVDEAETCIANAVMLAPEHTQILDLQEKIKKRKEHLEKLDAERRERESKKKWAADAIKIALQARNISTRKTSSPPELPDGIKIAFAEEGKPESGLTFPVLLIYHLHLQTDMIAAMPETTTVGEQLTEVLSEPLPWDEKKEYSVNSVECYMETKMGGLVKFGRKVSLLELLSGGKVEIVDGLVKVLVVPRARNAEFIEKWKKTMRSQQ
ncbi:tetratricopeptide repeat domain-containing protein [Sphaerosporella brunnea]|uniref:Tetratricopeptide repeat domain-containing protein n=1 Tax=Sphaerosporella brunnea TaxID=1250544 RepID=A0A5J5F0J7_9PEZI|nr:tetratricopeptide repeat domain-containing protein [Sphaerosporella brunnea]